MSELSVEEKAQRYDEAIKKVNDYYEGKTKLYSDVDKTLGYLFPELKESSEDENIRNYILSHLQQHLKAVREFLNSGMSAPFSSEEIKMLEASVAWLGKQREQNHASKMQVSEKLYEHIRNTCACIDDALSSETLADINDYLSMAKHSANSAFDMIEKQATPQTRTGNEWVNMIDDACDKRYSEEYANGEYCHEQSFKWGFQEGVEWLEKQDEQSSVIRWYDASLMPKERGELLVEWNGNGTIWHEIAFYHADTKTFWNGERQVENVTRWCYIVDLLGKQGKKVEPIGDFNSEFERQVSRLIASIINKEHEYTKAFIKWASDALLNYAKRELEEQGEQGTDISSFPKEQQVFMRKYVSLDKITLIKLLAERDANNAEIIESFEKQGNKEVPEKIYIDSNLENRTWLIGKGDVSFVEYIRADAFIEKAMKYLYEYNQNMVKEYGAKVVLGLEYSEFTINIDEFKKYMEE